LAPVRSIPRFLPRISGSGSCFVIAGGPGSCSQKPCILDIKQKRGLNVVAASGGVGQRLIGPDEVPIGGDCSRLRTPPGFRVSILPRLATARP
jgi:hypothetical protein